MWTKSGPKQCFHVGGGGGQIRDRSGTFTMKHFYPNKTFYMKYKMQISEIVDESENNSDIKTTDPPCYQM